MLTSLQNSTAAYPPGPKGAHLARLLWKYRRNALGFWQRLSEDYGDIIHFRLGARHVFFLRHPELYKDVLITRADHFTCGLGHFWTRRFWGNGLLSSNGAFHDEQRRLVQPSFSRQKLAAMASDMTSLAENASEQWRDGSTVRLWDEMSSLSARIVCKTLFDADAEREARDLVDSLTPVLDMLTRFYLYMLPLGRVFDFIPWPRRIRFEKAVTRMDECIYSMIDARRGEAGHRDAISALLDTGMSDKQIHDHIATLFFAGHDTTSRALTWTWYMLSQQPEVEKNVHTEFADVLGGRLPTAEDLPSLTYTQAFLSETLRLYPPVFTSGRLVSKELSIGGTFLPRGASVIISPFITQRDPRFFDDPLRFDPTRWRDNPRQAQLELAYLPFGAGARRCIGQHFARMEGTLLLATIGQKWRLRSPAGPTLKAEGPVIISPVDIPMRVEKRS